MADNWKHCHALSLARPTSWISHFQTAHWLSAHALCPLNSKLIPLPEQENQMMKDDLDCFCAVRLCAFTVWMCVWQKTRWRVWEAKLALFPLAIINKSHKHSNSPQTGGIKTFQPLMHPQFEVNAFISLHNEACQTFLAVPQRTLYPTTIIRQALFC